MSTTDPTPPAPAARTSRVAEAQGAAGERIAARIRQPRAGRGPALLPFITAGFPARRGFGDLLARTAELSDAIEIGLPFSDPMADGPVIAEASRRALADGASLSWLADLLDRERERIDAPLIVMSYYNPLFAPGLEATLRTLAQVGCDGLIVPDLPLEEAEPLRTVAESVDLALIQLVTPLTPPARRAELARAAQGFLYAVTRSGITGDRTEVEALEGYLNDLRALGEAPVCAGFGIRGPEQLTQLATCADGAIVGTALIEHLTRDSDPRPFLRHLLTFADQATHREESQP